MYHSLNSEDLKDYIEWYDSINESLDSADTEERKEKKERDKRNFYIEIESYKLKDIDEAIMSAEKSGDNDRKALLENFKEIVINAKKEMYKRQAPDIIENLVGLNYSSISYNEFAYWEEIEPEDLVHVEQALDKIKVNEKNFENISMRTNTDFIESAIKNAEKTGNESKKEKLQEIKNKIDRLRASATIYGYRYQRGTDYKVERKSDESILRVIDSSFKELGIESGAAYTAMNYIYVYLTNTKDKTDLLKRLQIVDEKLDEYTETLEKAYGESTYKSAMKSAITTAQKDFDNKDVLGIDKEVEGRESK